MPLLINDEDIKYLNSALFLVKMLKLVTEV